MSQTKSEALTTIFLRLGLVATLIQATIVFVTLKDAFAQKNAAEILTTEPAVIGHLLIALGLLIANYGFAKFLSEFRHDESEPTKPKTERQEHTVKQLKIEKLLRAKELELDVVVLEATPDENKNLHVLARRNWDRSYVVWSSYCTGEDATSYVGLYNGKYDLSLTDALEELKRRSGKEHI